MGFVWAQRQERKHEYADSEIVGMASASAAHNTIQVNLIAATTPTKRPEKKER
jgi:Uma2 family endonuclease